MLVFIFLFSCKENTNIDNQSDPVPEILPEVIYFKAEPNPVKSGDPYTVSWKVNNATKVEVCAAGDWDEVWHEVSMEGEWTNCIRTVSEDKDYMYYIRARNNFGEVEDSLILHVYIEEIDDKTKPVEIVYFKAEPNPVKSGEPYTVSWYVKNATKVEVCAAGDWEEVWHEVSSKGEWKNCYRTVSEDKDYMYYIRASNKLGQVQSSFVLHVYI